MPQKQGKSKVQQRTSVSAEVYGSWNKRQNYIPKIVKKSDEQIKTIRGRLDQAFMFSALDEKEKKIVVDAMEVRNFKAGDAVITQGEDGDVLYVVDSGKLDCFKKMKKDAPNTYLKTYVPGEAFGELALLYNAPRAASIIAKEDSTCFSLDRECFNGIVKDAAIKKRERYIDFLTRVEILDSLDSYEKTKICDCLQPSAFQAGQFIINQVSPSNPRASKATHSSSLRMVRPRHLRRQARARRKSFTTIKRMTTSANSL